MRKAWRIANEFRSMYEQATLDIPFYPGRDVPLDVYSPDENSGHPVLVFIHGGGWSRYTKALFAPLAMRLMTDGLVVVVPDHTPYPEAHYQDMADESAAAVHWTMENIEQYGGDPNRVVVAGHSSGGHLAALSVMDPKFLDAYGRTKDELCGLMILSSGCDYYAQWAFELGKGGPDGTELMELIIGLIGPDHLAEASPINYVQADLPPIMIVHGDRDKTAPVSEAYRFHAALQEAGAQSELKIHQGQGHSEIMLDIVDQERAQLVVDIAEFVHRVTQNPPNTIDETLLPAHQTHIQLHESHAMIAHE